MWGYEFESGGERKRTDVSFMFAMFDLHERMYGRQSNIVVLDEVDGRMDDDGVASLINIIKNDIANKVESVLVISHKNLMKDVFDKEIHVKRTDRFSVIENSHI
jgi:DNA repair exonuclease SbcCD ATPase subunit